MYFALFVVGLLGLFVAFYIGVLLFERIHLCDFVPAPPGEPVTDSPYFNAMNAAATRRGFVPAGVFVQQRKSKMYQARLAMWVSEDRTVLLTIAGGTTAKVPVKRTTLISVFEPNRIFQTQDEFGTVDLTGLTDREVVLNADLDELIITHRRKVAPISGTLRTFAGSNDLADWKAIGAMKAQQNARLGFIRFVAPDQTIWRHTLKGAWLQFSKGFRGSLAEAERQKDRSSIKRPGAD